MGRTAAQIGVIWVAIGVFVGSRQETARAQSESLPERCAVHEGVPPWLRPRDSRFQRRRSVDCGGSSSYDETEVAIDVEHTVRDECLGTVSQRQRVVPLTASESPAPPRVRDNGDAAIAELLRDARNRSATFRRLLETIDASDGLVYVERGECRAGLRACLIMTVVVSGPNRILRVRVDLARDRAAIIGSLGHELQHVTEVLRESGIRSDALLYGFYESLAGAPSARLGKLAFETDAAVQAGNKVRAEFEASRKAR
jgi:hypothetical protein